MAKGRIGGAGGLKERSSEGAALRRCLEWYEVVAMGVVGAGIFITVGAVARNNAGPTVIISYLLAGLTALLSAFCYTKFVVELPLAGGAFSYLKISLGEFAAYFIGANLIMEYVLANAETARTFLPYLTFAFLPQSYADAWRIKAPGLTYGFDQLDFVALCLVLLITLECRWSGQGLISDHLTSFFGNFNRNLDDKYDRFWVSPGDYWQDLYPRVNALAAPDNTSNTRPEVNNVPTKVMQDAWGGVDNISVIWPNIFLTSPWPVIVNPGEYAYVALYAEQLNTTSIGGEMNVFLDQYPGQEVIVSDKASMLVNTNFILSANGITIGITTQNSTPAVSLNALEFYGQFNFNFLTTAQDDDKPS